MWGRWTGYVSQLTQTVAPTVDSPVDQFKEEWLHIKSFYMLQKRNIQPSFGSTIKNFNHFQFFKQRILMQKAYHRHYTKWFKYYWKKKIDYVQTIQHHYQVHV